MATTTIQQDAVGVTLRVVAQDEDGVAVSYSDATTVNILLTAPGGTTTSKTAAFTTDGTDGSISYTTVASDLSTKGTWQIQGRFCKTGLDVYTAIDTFKVLGNLA